MDPFCAGYLHRPALSLPPPPQLHPPPPLPPTSLRSEVTAERCRDGLPVTPAAADACTARGEVGVAHYGWMARIGAMGGWEGEGWSGTVGAWVSGPGG